MTSGVIKYSIFTNATALSNLLVVVSLRYRRLRDQKRHFGVLVRAFQHGKVQQFVTCLAALVYAGLFTII
jgi:hypothetical protein